MSPDLALTHVTERDMDLLLVEELKCSPDFRSWLLKQLPTSLNADHFLKSDATATVRHSIERTGEGYGETDIEVELATTGPTNDQLLLFIEDKITAPFTPNQPQRYRQAADAARRDGRAIIVACVLFAPEGYLSQVERGIFDLTIPYEAIADYFASKCQSTTGELAARYAYRHEVTRHAIGKFRRGYEAITDPTNTRFWRQYFELVSQMAPELQLDPPGDKPTFSIDIYFKRAFPLIGGLRKAWLLKHSLENAAVMIEISQWGRRYAEIAPLLEGAKESDMIVRQAGKSIQIKLVVPNLDTSAPFGDQIEDVKQGVASLQRLQRWYLNQASVITRCQNIAEP